MVPSRHARACPEHLRTWQPTAPRLASMGADPRDKAEDDGIGPRGVSSQTGRYTRSAVFQKMFAWSAALCLAAARCAAIRSAWLVHSFSTGKFEPNIRWSLPRISIELSMIVAISAGSLRWTKVPRPDNFA